MARGIEGEMTEEIRKRIEDLLDAALTGEPPPAGVDPAILEAMLNSGEESGEQADTYALWSAMTSLTQETKLQGRAFQDLNLALGGQAEKIGGELKAVYADRERALQREAERKVRREVLAGLIDLRDRLGRGRDSVEAQLVMIPVAPPVALGWWARLAGKRADVAATGPSDAMTALIRGYELSLERLEQMLGEFNAREIRCLGQAFDPKTMNAIESEESSKVPADTVLEVYRSGYEWNGEVFRTAQVKVARSGVEL